MRKDNCTEFIEEKPEEMCRKWDLESLKKKKKSSERQTQQGQEASDRNQYCFERTKSVYKLKFHWEFFEVR